MSAPNATKVTLPLVFFCLAFFPFFLAGLQGALRLSHAVADWKFGNEGDAISAVIMETEHAVLSRDFGGETHHSQHWWVRYLPDGKEEHPDNLLWESVTPGEFESYHEGQRIEAWVLPDAHRIKGRGQFRPAVPEWVFLGVGGVFVALGFGLKRRAAS